MSVRCMEHVPRNARTQKAAMSVSVLTALSLLVNHMGLSVLLRVRFWHKNSLDMLAFLGLFPPGSDILISVKGTHQCCSCQTTSASAVSTCPLISIQTMWTMQSTFKPWITFGIQRVKASVSLFLQDFLIAAARLNINRSQKLNGVFLCVLQVLFIGQFLVGDLSLAQSNAPI